MKYLPPVSFLLSSCVSGLVLHIIKDWTCWNHCVKLLEEPLQQTALLLLYPACLVSDTLSYPQIILLGSAFSATLLSCMVARSRAVQTTSTPPARCHPSSWTVRFVLRWYADLHFYWVRTPQSPLEGPDKQMACHLSHLTPWSLDNVNRRWILSRASPPVSETCCYSDWMQMKTFFFCLHSNENYISNENRNTKASSDCM